ncbi:MAG TPA: glycosyltransferase [Chitinispirillaceae bacterium]|nr:glycosyltransferase [Chitinispirillaceae bacterium]
MNVMMMTNVYTPFIGGVSRSVETLTSELRNQGHRVIIVTPDFENTQPIEKDVIRVPAVHHFNGSDFSVQLPFPGILHAALKDFTPDIIHSHHPFMLGDTALRISSEFEIPVVFTHHTFYEKYTHYVNSNSALLKTFIKTLATEYANHCNLVVAPSKSVARILKARGVISPVRILPTGIDTVAFSKGDGTSFRKKYAIPVNSTVAGFVSRIAVEKNVLFLSSVLKEIMTARKDVYFLVVGNGPSLPEVKEYFTLHGLSDRLILPGALLSQDLIDAYHAMDLFVFASKTETQGLVILEALASGIPVIAVRGPAIEDIVNNFTNGRIVSEQSVAFTSAFSWFVTLPHNKKKQLKENALSSARFFSKENYAANIISEYKLLISNRPQKMKKMSSWQKLKGTALAELELLKIFTIATGTAIRYEHL